MKFHSKIFMVFAGFGVLFLLLKEKNSQEIQIENKPALSLDKTPTLIEKAAVKHPSHARQASDQLRLCLGVRVNLYGHEENLLLDRLENSFSKAIRSQISWENIHFVDNNGESKRIRREAEDNLPGKWTTQVFALDSEDLPVPIDLPTELIQNSGATGLQNYLFGKQIQVTERERLIAFENGADARLIIRNGELTDLEIRFDRNTFKCRQNLEDCACL